MDPELKKALDALNMTLNEAAEAQDKALAAFREESEKNDKARDAANDEKLAKINEELAKFETLNEAIQKAEARATAEEEARKEMQDSVDRIEAKINRPGGAGAEAEADMRAKAFEAFARKGVAGLTGDYQNVLQVSDDNSAGRLATPEFVMSILKEIEEYSMLRGLVTVRTTGSRSVQMPKRTALPSAVWVGETETRPDTEGLAYGMLEIPVHEATMAVPISNQMLEDSDFDIMNEIREATSLGFAKQEAAAVISGNKDGKPEGFLNAAGTVGKTSGVVGDITADDLISLKYGIKTGYATNGSFVLNRPTLEKVRKMKDGNGQYLWASGLAAGRASTIDGEPYAEQPDMPNVGTGLKPVAFGDWKRGYILVDRIAMSMLRDDYTRAGNGQVLFRWRRRLGGAVSIAEAIAILTVQ
jgi:HK97 family phage major capsid protein